MPQVVPAEVVDTDPLERLPPSLVLTCRTGLPLKLNTCVECLPSSRITITAAALNDTAIALRPLAWSA